MPRGPIVKKGIELAGLVTHCSWMMLGPLTPYILARLSKVNITGGRRTRDSA